MQRMARVVCLGACSCALLACSGAHGGAGGTSSSGGASAAAGSSGASSSGGASGAAGSGGSGGSAGAGGSAGSGTPPVLTPVSQSTASVHEGEPTIAVAPDGTIAVAWMAFPSGAPYQIGYAFSKDGGKTFTKPATLSAPDGRAACDPVLAADAQSNFHLAWLAYRAPTEPNKINSDARVLVSLAPAGSTTFGATVQASDPANAVDVVLDKPWIIVTPSGALLVSYMRQDSFLTVVAARSENGTTFSRSTLIAEPNFYELVQLCASAALGRVYAAFFRGNGDAALRSSDDDGKTWPASSEVTVSAPGEVIGFDDPRCIASGKDVWVSYGIALEQFVPGAEGAALLSPIRVAHSSNAGASFDQHVDVTTAADGAAFMHPGFARDAAGALDVVYYAGSGDNDSKASLRTARAATNLQFGSSRVMSQPVTLTRENGGSAWFGDYIGVTSAADSLWVAFTDNSNGQGHIVVARQE